MAVINITYIKPDEVRPGWEQKVDEDARRDLTQDELPKYFARKAELIAEGLPPSDIALSLENFIWAYAQVRADPD